jgi:16S rRNA (guanine(527)-N(7))-methyltransferase RsmG
MRRTRRVAAPRAKSRPAPDRNAFRALLARGGIRLDATQLDRLWRYHNLLRSRNQGSELTRLIGFESMVVKHYVDSMIVADLCEIPSPLVDVGTGAGLPGIPLKIRLPKLKLVLAEPRPKRVEFLHEAVRELRLEGVGVFPHKVVSRSFTQPMKGAISRALEPIEKTVLRTSGCLSEGGLLLFLKGPAVAPEIQAARVRFGSAIEVVLDKSYVLPGTRFDRRLVVLRRTGDSASLEAAA